MTYTIAFVGNPNVGKSAWINALAKADFKVGNWAGVTVEKKEAHVVWGNETYHLIDLPGTHSLEEGVNEEGITGSYLRQNKVDLLVNVLDATNLAANLYLTLCLRELQIPMLVLFSFIDEVENMNMHIDTLAISRRLALDCLEVSVLHKQDYKRVRKAICQMVQKPVVYEPLLQGETEKFYVSMFNYLQAALPQLSLARLHRILCGYMENDRLAYKQLESFSINMEQLQSMRKGIDKLVWLKERYQAIHGLMYYVSGDEQGHYAKTRKLDRIFLHPIWGFVLFLLFFTTLLFLIFQLATPWNDFIAYLVEIISRYAYVGLSFLPNFWRDALLKGVVAGVGGVLSFLPLMLCLYFFLAFLEESGYMARISFLMDRIMRCFHLSGKSFVALMLGFGCNVPAIYATKAMDSEQQKKLTALLVPFMSCGARLPLYALFASAFFTNKGGIMIVTMYALGICMALLLALLFSKSKVFASRAMVIGELPLYRIPRFSVVWQKVKKEVMEYIKKAVGIVSLAMLVMWGLAYFPNGNMASGYIAQGAKAMQPFFEPLGFGNRWESIAALPGGIIAKETIVGWYEQLLQAQKPQTYELSFQEDIKGIVKEAKKAFYKSFLFFLPQEEERENTISVSMLWQDRYAKLRAFCFMVYVLFSMPCIMSLQAMWHVYGWRLTLFSIGLMLLVPYVSTLFIFQLFRLLL